MHTDYLDAVAVEDRCVGRGILFHVWTWHYSWVSSIMVSHLPWHPLPLVIFLLLGAKKSLAERHLLSFLAACLLTCYS